MKAQTQMDSINEHSLTTKLNTEVHLRLFQILIVLDSQSTRVQIEHV